MPAAVAAAAVAVGVIASVAAAAAAAAAAVSCCWFCCCTGRSVRSPNHASVLGNTFPGHRGQPENGHAMVGEEPHARRSHDD